MSHLDDDVGNRDEYLLAREDKVSAKLSLNIMMTTSPITGKLVTAESRRQPKMEHNLLHLRRRPLLLLPTLHLNPLGVVQRPKKPANLLPMPFRKTSHCLQASTFSTQRAILMCHSLRTRRVYNFVEGASKEQLESIFRTCTTAEIIYLDKFLPRVPKVCS